MISLKRSQDELGQLRHGPGMRASDGLLRLEVVRNPSDFIARAQEWNSVLTKSGQGRNPMLTHEWFRAWWESFGEGKELLILFVKSGNTIIGIAPFMRYWTSYYGVPVRLLSLITNEHTNRCEFILADRPQECVRLVLDFVHRNATRWDLVDLNFLPTDSPTVEAIREQAAQFELLCGAKPSYHSPFITLKGDWESFYGGLDGHFRRNMRNREKRLARRGAIRYEEASGPPDTLLPEMFEVGELSWKGLQQTAIASTTALLRFYTRLAELTYPKGWLSLHLLRVGETPVAFQYSLRNDDGIYLLKTEYDTAYQRYSPGHQIQKHVLERCFALGLREFDFLGPDMPWKQVWASQVRPHVRLLLFHRGLWSRTLAFLELQVKPALKRSLRIRRLGLNPPDLLEQ